jgi:hypothetical protein
MEQLKNKWIKVVWKEVDKAKCIFGYLENYNDLFLLILTKQKKPFFINRRNIITITEAEGKNEI